MFKLMLVPFDRERKDFADQEFNKFCQEHNIIRIEKEFFNADGNTYYSFLIEYEPLKKGNNQPDLGAMSDSERNLYNCLRVWRREIAEREGVPAYFIMHNSQLFEIIKANPQTITDFAAVKGMKAKASKYGEQIIRILHESEHYPEE